MTDQDGSSPKPLWTEEFSVYAAEDAYVLRRQFTKFLVLTSFSMLAGNAWIWVRALVAKEPQEWPKQALARASSMLPGTVRLFTYPGPHDSAVLVRRVDGGFAAFSQKCTHLSCAVYYAPERNRLEYAGEEMSEHTAPFDALVLTLDGALTLTIGGKQVHATPQTIVLMPANVPHAVHAPGPAHMLLIMLREPAQSAML